MKKIICFVFVLMGTVTICAQEKNYSYDLNTIASFFDNKTEIGEIHDGIIILYQPSHKYIYGAINNKGDIVVPFEYENLNMMNDGMIKASKKGPDGKTIYGYFNLANGLFIFNQYTKNGDKFYNGVAETYFNGQTALINKKGELVSTPMNSNNYIIDDPKYGMRIIWQTKDEKKMGAYNAKGQLVIPIKYNYIWGESKTQNGFKNGIAKARLNDKIVYLKKDGTLLKTKAEIIEGGEFDGSFAFVKTTQGAGVIDLNGEFYNFEKAPELGKSYDDILYSKTDGLFIAKKRNTNKFGFVNKYGEVIVPVEYSMVEEFVLGLAQVGKKTEDGMRYGYVNTNGELIVDCVYNGRRYLSENDDDYPNEYSDSIRIVCLNNKYGYVNNKGELITEIEYDKLKHFFKGVGVVKKGEKYGFVNTKGELITQIDYDWVEKSSDGVWLVKNGGKYGYVSNKGEITKIEFDSAEPFLCGLGKARKNDFIGLVDINGNSTFDYIK